MKAMILAAGVGSCLRPLTLFMPRCMVPIANKPVMEYTIGLLARHGVKEIAANLHYLPDQIERYFGDGQRWGVHLTYSLERQLLGSAGAVRRMAEFLAPHESGGPFWVLSGDALTDLDLTDMLRYHQEHHALATIALQEVEDPSRYGVAHLAEDGRVLRFQEKPQGEEPLSKLANLGIYLFEPQILQKIPAGETYDFAHQLFPKLLQEGAGIYGYRAGGYWNKVGNFAEYRQAQGAVLNQRLQGVLLPYRQAEPGVWIGQGVSIHPRARLVPPVLVGDHCQVRAEAIIGPETVLGNQVIVDEAATVMGSTVLEGTYVGRLVKVAEAVANRNCLISVPADASVFVADRFLLGEAGADVVQQGLERAFFWLLALVMFLLSLPLWLPAFGLALLAGRGPLFTAVPCVSADEKAHYQTGRIAWHTVALTHFRADPQTAPGRWLRRLGWDRLPLLLAVLRGELALVGVGPLPPGQADGLGEEWQRQRFLHPAGLTGLWYVNADRPMPADEQLIVDGYYAVTRNWRGDLRILWQTPAAWLRHFRSG